MARYGNVTILPADPNPWASALGLLGGIMGKNAADRQGVKDTDAFISSVVPTDTNPTMQAPNATATTGGLLSGNLKDNISAGMTPQVAPQAMQTQPQTQQFKQTPQMATMPQQQTMQPQQAQPKTWNDVRNQYNVNWGTKLKATLANMSPEARKQYLPQIMQMREQDLATLKTDWTKQETANNWDAFNAETDPKKKLFIGTKLSLPPESMKMLLEPDTKTQLVNMGGKYVQVGTNAYTGKMINMETGQPLTADDLQMTMTPYQEGTLAETTRHNGVMESRPTGGGTGSSGVGKYVEIPGVGLITTNEAYNLYQKALGKDTETVDEFGMTKVVKGQRNDEVANLLRPLLIPNSNGGGGGDDESVDYGTFMKNAMAAGYTQDEAQAKYEENTGS